MLKSLLDRSHTLQSVLWIEEKNVKISEPGLDTSLQPVALWEENA